MKWILLSIFNVVFFTSISQNYILEEFDSFNGIGEWITPTNAPNAGSESGLLCYNISSNYPGGQWMMFESPALDFTGWSSVEIMWDQSINIRNGDYFRLYYLDGLDNSWYYFELGNLNNGAYFASIPITAIQVTFDLISYGSGSRSGRYAHIDYIQFIDPTPLPVELIYFEGAEKNGINFIEWATASEYNCTGYDIEWSTDGYSWKIITSSIGAGTSTTENQYSEIHTSYEEGVNYYRLIQWDFDGKNETYGPISINNSKSKRRVLYYINTMGQKISLDSHQGYYIVVYDDGSRENKIKF